jgi:hypothetical protein
LTTAGTAGLLDTFGIDLATELAPHSSRRSFPEGMVAARRAEARD